MQEFREKYKYGKNAERPMLFIYWPSVFMKEYIQDYQAILRDYDDMFDVFYCSDVNEARLYFNMDEMND